jgi:serine protease
MQAYSMVRAVAVLFMLCLAGCGGGGGGGASPGTESSNGGGGNSGTGGTPARPTLTLQANPLSVTTGGSTTLSWSATAADTCSASGGWSGARATSGSQTLTNLQTSASYSLACSNSAGQVSESVQVSVALPAVPTITITATPALAERGQNITISWSAPGATQCISEWPPYNSNRSAQGSDTYSVNPTFPSGQIYLRMTCYGAGGSSSETLVVPVRTLSGELRAPPGVFADSDVNDPTAPYFSNDVQPRSVMSFGLFPGYVNVAGQGPQGRSFATGDQWDYFVIENATAGQIARLILPTHDASQPAAERDDADLYLYDRDYGTLIDASIGSGAEEVLEFPSNNYFILGVKAEHGGFNYLLSLEDPPLGSSLSNERLNSDFVPGEAIVTLTPGAATLGPAGSQSRNGVRISPLRTKAGGVGRPMLMELSTETANQATAVAQKQTRRYFGQKAEAAMTPQMRSKLATLYEVKRLSQLDGVQSASVNRIVHAQLAPTDPLYARQRWHYESIFLPAAWDITTGSSNVVVAVVDSGAVTDHPDLQSKYVDGYDMVDMDADFTDPGYEVGGVRIYHGTHVMGTVGAVANNGAGGSGVAWGSRVMPIRALEGRTGTAYDVMQAIRYAAGMPNDSGRVPSRPADIINLSLGSSGACSPAEAALFTEIAARGITVVAAAGNERSNYQFSPASCPSVFGVAATGPGGNLATYSNFGPLAVVAAPGGDTRYDADGDGFLDGIFSTSGERQGGLTIPSYTSIEGTSMAAPHVSGVFALMKSVKPTLTPLEFRQLLQGGWMTDRDPGSPSPNELGYGIINAYKAVRAAGDNFTPPARVGATPGLLDLTRASPSATFQLRNSGIGALSVSNVSAAATWLSVVPENVDANGLGGYRATADANAVPRGVHRTTVDVQSTAGLVQVPVVFTKLIYNIQSNLGALHLRVNDATSGETVRERTYTQHNYLVQYRLDDVPFGKYVILAGTDFNNDGNLCDPGEICGAYPVRSVPEPVEFTGVAQELNIELALMPGK